jgi:hypothetical protein
METPVLFIIFNRPETTFKVFGAIRQAKPKKLFIAADGPRSNKVGEKELCAETRKITELIDWPCEVKTLFRDKNLGCGEAVSGAITWFFQNIEEGIILEDDCLPSPSFFNYCEKMLERYRNETKIMMVSGSNPATSLPDLESDYYYSKVYSIWGWATWKRAWKLYNKKIPSWPTEKNSKLLMNFYHKKTVADYFWMAFDNVYNNRIDTWDYQWTYNCIINNGLSIVPKYNMISNIGVTGTHTGEKISSSLFLKNFNTDVGSFISPKEIQSNQINDNLLFKVSGIDKLSIKLTISKILAKIGLYNIVRKIIKILR